MIESQSWSVQGGVVPGDFLHISHQAQSDMTMYQIEQIYITDTINNITNVYRNLPLCYCASF